MNDAVKPKIKSKELPVDWGELRAQASKLGLALSEFQQQEKQRKLRLEKKGAAANCDQVQTGRTACYRMQSAAEIRPYPVSEFTKYVGDLCTRLEVDIDRLAGRLTMDPTELLKMINGRLMPTNVVLSGLARELDTDLRYLEKLAEEIHLGDQPDE
jgi:ribosome-binding protein aMBF1 (putative translation factor)